MVFTKDTKIREITKHHSFRGFGHLFHIYDEDEMVKYPSKRETGLFLALSQRGYNAFALIYRPKKAYEDLAQALDYLYSHAGELKIAPNRYSLWGGSAGMVVSQYTGYSSVSRDDAPTYANCGTNDWIANWQVMENRLKNLKKIGIDSRFQVYKGLRHGFGIG